MDKKLIKRKFLNDDEGMAAIQIFLKKIGEEEWDADATISDCNRSVKLDFHFWNKKTKRLKMKKIDTLILMLQELRAEMETHTPTKSGN